MKTGILAYVPDLQAHSRFVTHFQKYRTILPTYIITDNPRYAGLLRVEVLSIPRIGPFHSYVGGRTPSNFYADWAFSNAIYTALSMGWDYFIYVESDCRFGADEWDRIYMEDFDRYSNKDTLFGGTPVCWHPWHINKEFSMQMIDYAFVYQSEADVPMAFESNNDPSIGTCFYPNGALGIYNVTECADYFKRFLPHLGKPQSKQFEISALTVRNFDTHIGYEFVERYGLGVFKRFAAIPSVYSGCKDHYVSIVDRINFLLTGKKTAVHHLKEHEYPFVEAI